MGIHLFESVGVAGMISRSFPFKAPPTASEGTKKIFHPVTFVWFGLVWPGSSASGTSL
jgi:hypothetical protein